LARLGRLPITRFLSTTAALDLDVQAGAWQRGQAWTVAPALAEAWSLDPNGIA
jgi:hypothetical protein